MTEPSSKIRNANARSSPDGSKASEDSCISGMRSSCRYEHRISNRPSRIVVRLRLPGRNPRPGSFRTNRFCVRSPVFEISDRDALRMSA